MTIRSLDGLPPAEARVTCSGERHVIRWEAGDLIALDHGDAEGERALAVLGGTTCACVDTLSAWTRRRDDPRLLTALSRGPCDVVRPQELPPGLPMTSGPRVPHPSWVSRGGVTASRAMGSASYSSLRSVAFGGPVGSSTSPSATAEEDIALLVGLGRSVTVRLVASVTAVLLEQMATNGPYSPRLHAVLEVSLYGRALCTLRSWLGVPNMQLDLGVIEPEETPVVEEVNDYTIGLGLPLQWVSEVWGRDLAVVAGRFSLAVVESTDPRTTLRTLGPDLGAPRLLEIVNE